MNLSELEQIRLDNISRNSKYLAELGIHAVSNVQSRKSRSSVNRTPAVVTYVEPVRRSSRIASLQEPVSYVEEGISPSRSGRISRIEIKAEEPSNDSSSSKRRKTHSSDLPVGSFLPSASSAIGVNAVNVKVEMPESRPGFSSGMNADIEFWCSPKQLGCPVEAYGKAAVMSMSLGISEGFYSRSINASVRFNKYSGVAEWKNALFLWVNIIHDGSGQYENSFSAGGQYMMWFGGSTMHAESRIVQRLIHPCNQYPLNEKKDVAAAVAADNIVLLFVRRESEGYACLGRCKYVAVNLQMHPIEIKWQLLDFDLLRNTLYFQELCKAK